MGGICSISKNGKRILPKKKFVSLGQRSG